MPLKRIITILAISGLLVSCDKNNSSGSCPGPKLNCDGVECLLYSKYFDFRLVDKTTGADLVFGPAPRYSESDIALYADAGQTIPLALSADASAQQFKTIQGEEEMYLVVGGTTYKITATYKAVDCCSSRVKDLAVNGMNICTCCADAIEIGVE